MTIEGERGSGGWMSGRRLALGVACALVVLVCAAFWPSLEGEYLTWDDQDNFVKNTMWQGLGGENLRWMFTTFHMGHWQPLTWVSFGLQHEAFGGGPRAGHAVNIVLHALNGVLFFVVAARLLRLVTGGGEGCPGRALVLGAGVGAAFFALHPLRVESVAWITERRDLLSAAFLLGAMAAYLRAVSVGEARVRSVGWYVGSVVLAALSCMSKAWGMSFFVVLMAVDLYPLRRVEGLSGWFRRGGLQVLAEKAPFAVIGLVTAYLGARAQGDVLAARSLELWPIENRLVQACYGLWFYVRQTVWPSGHSALYEVPEVLDPWAARYVAGYAGAALLLGLALWGWRRARGVTIGLFIYVVLVSPVLGVLQSGDQMVADRYTYLATMPMAVGVGWLMVRVWGLGAGERAARVRLLAGLVTAAVLGVFVVASRAQSRVWLDSRTLWENAVAVEPGYRVLFYLGRLVRRDDPERARELFRRAVEINPEFGSGWFEYAGLSQRAGDLSEAERGYLRAAAGMPQPFLAHVDLGVMYFVQGRREEGVVQLRLAVETMEARPDQVHGKPYMLMGLAMAELGRREEAAGWFRKAAGFEETRADAAEELKKLGVRE